MSAGLSMQERVDSYLNHTLSEKAKIDFELELEINIQLKNKLELTMLANKAIMQHKLQNIKTLTRERIKEGNSSNPKLIKYAVSGITLSLIISVAFWFGFKNDNIKAINLEVPDTQISKIKSPDDPKVILKDPVLSSNSFNRKVTPAAKRKNLDAFRDIGISEKKLIEHEQPIKDHIVNEAHLKEVTSPELVTIEDLCQKTKHQASYTTENPCTGKENGKIYLSDIKGGEAPYIVSIFNLKNESEQNGDLKPGYYNILITDNNACSTQISNIKLSEVHCIKDFQINPELNEILELGKYDSQAILTIFDQSEGIYFKSNYNPGEDIVWNGISQKGEIKPGYFLFVLKVENQPPFNGSVTIVR